MRRITPAYAGNTKPPFGGLRFFGDHPRIRGEHFPKRYNSGYCEGSPPHTRGTRILKRTKNAKKRITPAYAGNTGKTPLTA